MPEWLPIMSLWYVVLALLSMLSFPLGAYIFRALPDRGYPMYRVLTIGIVGYCVFFLGRYSLAPFTPLTIVSVSLVYGLIQLLLYRKNYISCSFPSWRTVLNYELVFVGFFTLWCYIRGQEPSLRSLEKFMDLGFTMSAYRNTTIPPLDMWYAKETINYYYFGHYLTALLSKVSMISPHISYNLMLETILATSLTISFSLGSGLYHLLIKNGTRLRAAVAGIISALILNFGGNLHTLYLFTKGYVDDNPVPFWHIWSSWNPTEYWYPRATRFIPFTIHEFPSYSYIVADLHGHLVNVMNVLLLYGLFLVLLSSHKEKHEKKITLGLISVFLAISYMTNATDLLVYTSIAFLVITVQYVNLRSVFIRFVPVLIATALLIVPFASRFQQFSNSIGINCAPPFLISRGSFGPLLFEADKCQSSPLWMLAVLWGFFWFVFIVFLAWFFFRKKIETHANYRYFIFFTFAASIILTFAAEFIYFKDIYPNHFRANTMFKLGYQAFIMMSLASGPIIVTFIRYAKTKHTVISIAAALILVAMLGMVSIYSFFGISSYYGPLGKFKTLDGSAWIKESYPQHYDIIVLLRAMDKRGRIKGNLLEANGDSYTDFNMVSAHTGIPTVVGWGVHQWLWRKDYGIAVAPRARDVQTLYTSSDMRQVKALVKKYDIHYVVVSSFEREKYPNLKLAPWYIMGRPLYEKNGTYLFELSDDEQ